MGSSPLTRGKRQPSRGSDLGIRLIPAHAGKTRCLFRARKRQAAHPRSRGENCDRLPVGCPRCGSSPLTRGKPHRNQGRQKRARLIPAHAGKTCEKIRVHDWCPAHPRSRGENQTAFPWIWKPSGSSPLTRGKLDVGRQSVIVSGLIPAHAGKTPARRASMGRGEAHPRSRGENFHMGIPRSANWGSSPLTRGKRVVIAGDGEKLGLIPAHAGKTTARKPAARKAPAHPRSRGENYASQGSERTEYGSSPLTRGKPTWTRSWGRTSRLIPAHAGKTCRQRPSFGVGRAHPRSRGENCPHVAARVPQGGSSPLTRGKQSRPPGKHYPGRLIPAHAGKTVSRMPLQSSGPAHPRSRGENAKSAPRRPKEAGSSPLTRGKPSDDSYATFGSRLIPAHAGKTRPRYRGRGRCPAHPRSRGENPSIVRLTYGFTGSSPLTRGKHFLTCAFTAQIDQILETLELAASSGSYSIWVACATDAPQDQVQSIGLVLPSSRGAS